MSNPTKIIWSRVIGYLCMLLVSAAVSYFVQPLISENNDAINTVVTVFSILAGFLIAVITFIGDPGARGWQELQLDKKAVEAKLRRHRWLFYMYLVTLGLALVMFVIPDECVRTVVWLERLFVFCAVLVFIASFTLPKSLTALQMDRYEDARNAQLPDILKKLGGK